MTINTEIDEITTEDRDESRFRTLESRAIKGTYFIVAFYGLSSAIRLLSAVVLAKLFAPELFGVMALTTAVIVGLNLFSHIGLEDSIIQNPRGDEETFVNTAWTMQAIRGIGLWLLTIILAWPFVLFYPSVHAVVFHAVWLLPVMGFGCVIAGFSSPNLLTLSRHLGVGKLSLLELISQVVLFAFSLIWAWFQPTIWALAFGRVAAELVRMFFSYRLMSGGIRPRFVLEGTSVKALLGFGRWILIGTALTFLASQSDRLMLGRLTTPEILGVYGIAFSLSDLPRQIIQMFSSKVGFPFIAKFAHQARPEFRKVLIKYRMMVLAAGAVLLATTICVGDIFIHHAYDSRYQNAAWMIALFGIGLWHTLLYNTITPAIMSLQKAHYNALANLLYCVALFIFLPLGYLYFGIVGAVAAAAFSDLPVYFVNIYASYKQGLGMLRQDALMTLFFLAALAVGLGIRHAFGLGVPFPGLPHLGHF